MSPTAFVPTTLPHLTLKATKPLTLTHPPLSTSLRPLTHPHPQLSISTPQPPPPSPAARPTRILLWFHTDLRLSDNPALANALQTATLPGGCLIPLCQPHTLARPLAQHLKALLRDAGSDLITPVANLQQAIIDVCDRLKLHAVYFNRACSRVDVALQNKVVAALSRAGIKVEAFWGNTLTASDALLRKKQLLVSDVRAEALRTNPNPTILAPPQTIPRLPTAAASIRQAPLAPSRGLGTPAAIRLLRTMRKNTETLHLSSSPHLAVLLQNHLRFGTVSPRMVAVKVNNVMNTLSGRTFSELVWRSYEALVTHRAAGITSVKTTVVA